MRRWTNSRLIWQKEMKSLMRDKKALLTIFLPILIYPVLMIFFIGVSGLVEDNLSENIRRIAFEGEVPLVIQTAILDEAQFELGEVVGSYEESINEDSLDLVVRGTFTEGVTQITLLYNSAMDSSMRGKRKVADILETYRSQLIAESIKAINLEHSVLEIIDVETIEVTDESSSSRVIASVLGIIIPFILVMYSVIGIYSITSDLSAGEKERFTLETIFSIPIPKKDIILGKLFAGVTVGLMSGVVNIISMFPLIYAMTLMISEVSINLNPLLPLFILLMLLPVMLLTCAVMLGFGLFAKTYQEAQSYGAFVMMAFMLLSYIGIIPDLSFSVALAFLPITNSILAMRDGFVGDFSMMHIGITLGVNIGLAGLSILFMTTVFSSESIIFGHSKKSKFQFKFKSLLGGRHE